MVEERGEGGEREREFEGRRRGQTKLPTIQDLNGQANVKISTQSIVLMDVRLEQRRHQPDLRRTSLPCSSICEGVFPISSRTVSEAPCSSSSETTRKFLARYATCRAAGAYMGKGGTFGTQPCMPSGTVINSWPPGDIETRKVIVEEVILPNVDETGFDTSIYTKLRFSDTFGMMTLSVLCKRASTWMGSQVIVSEKTKNSTWFLAFLKDKKSDPKTNPQDARGAGSSAQSR